MYFDFLIVSIIIHKALPMITCHFVDDDYDQGSFKNTLVTPFLP